MDRSDIPRVDMARWAADNFTGPFLPVEAQDVDASLFRIHNRKDHPANDYISPNRRQFFKIMHVTGGTGILTIGLHQYMLRPGHLVFIHPDEIISWQEMRGETMLGGTTREETTRGEAVGPRGSGGETRSEKIAAGGAAGGSVTGEACVEGGATGVETGGHFCLMHPAWFGDAAHMLQLFRHYPYFQASRAVIQLNEGQSAVINQYFERILEEANGEKADKKQAIFLYLQMILLEAQRAGKNLAEVAVPEHYRYIHGFLALLESTFQIKGPDTVVTIRTATEFAEQLHLHPNYLNALVKGQTGKTLREHIQERLLYEAKVLLRHTGWEIRTISYVLGFSEQAAFATFFTKKEKVSPSLYRERAGSSVNS